MRKGRDGEWKKNGKKMEKKNGKKITAEIVATTSLPVDRLTATDCNAGARANNMCITLPPPHSLKSIYLWALHMQYHYTVGEVGVPNYHSNILMSRFH